MKEVAAVVISAENTAFQTCISGSLFVPQSLKYRRNRITKGLLRHSHTDRVRIQDRVLIYTARVSGLDVMHTLNLLTMGVTENTEMGCLNT